MNALPLLLAAAWLAPPGGPNDLAAPIPVLAGPAKPASTGPVKLADLVPAYASCPPVAVDISVPDAKPGEGHLVRLVLSPDGRFTERHWIENRSRNHDEWRKTPYQLTYADNTFYRTTEHGGSSEYTEADGAAALNTAPGPIQWAACPAVMAPRLVRWLESAPDLVLDEPGPGLSRAASLAHKLALTWDDKRRIVSVLYGDPAGSFIRYDYADFAPLLDSLPPLPRSRAETIVIAGKSGPDAPPRAKVALAASLVAEPEKELTFNAGALKLNRYDPVSGDVFAPDGALLYNKKRFEAGLDQGSWLKTLRPWAFTGVGGAVALGALLAIRRAKTA